MEPNSYYVCNTNGTGYWIPSPTITTAQYLTVSSADHTHSYTVAPLEDRADPVPCKAVCPPKSVGVNKKAKKMDYRENEWGDQEAVSLAAKKLDYLSIRLNGAQARKYEELRKLFGLDDDDQPKTVKDLVDRIKNNKFVLRNKDRDEDAEFYYSNDVFRALRWRDPSLNEDVKGYRAAEKLLEAESRKVEDLIQIGDPKDALTAITALESWTPTGLAN